MTISSELKRTVLVLIDKISNLQKGIDQTVDEHTKAELSVEQDLYLSELKKAIANLSIAVTASSASNSVAHASAEEGYPTV